MAARTITPRNERRDAAAAAAESLDAAFFDLEPGASVASDPSPDADDAGAAPSDRSRRPATASGVRPLLAALLPRRRRRRRARLRVRYA
jgi:hypothetical protein